MYRRRRMMSSGANNTYYVDFTSGNDSYTGKSSSSAWKTITKINATIFPGGSRVLLKCGETWTGICLVPKSGVTYADYGTGTLPIIDGNDTVNCMKNTAAVSNIIIRNIEFKKGLNFGIQFYDGCSNIVLDTVTVSACGNDNINFMLNCSNIQILNCTSYNPYDRLSDGSTISCVEIADDCHDVVVDNLTAYGSPMSGLSIHSHDATTMPYNIEVKNSLFYGCAYNGIQVNKADANVSANLNIYIHNFTIRDNIGAGACGIRVKRDVGAEYLIGVLFDNGIIRDTGSYSLLADNTAKFTRCVFEGTGRAKVDSSKNMVFWNNTFYHATTWPFECLGTNDGLEMKNNIFYANFDTQVIKIAAITNVTIDYNLYFSLSDPPLRNQTLWYYDAGYHDFYDWKDHGLDAHSPIPADPLFTDAAGHDWTLQVGSPAINVGVDVGLPYLGIKPDLGAFEKA